jgi:carotenoid cleavage dioxygenase-like enzyme
MRKILRPAPLTRRLFLQRSAMLATGLALPGALLQACGDADTAAPLVVDPNTPFWLQGNFAPVHDEVTAFDLPVRGRIPSELNGLYVRNGSNPQSGDSPHWFFGDGMIHGVKLEDGQAAWYRNRYVRTPFYERGVGFGGVPGLPTGGNHQSNVSCVYHGGQLLLSGEVGAPYRIDPSDLSTIGVQDYGGAIKTSFTAHPKIDPATGNLHFFGYWFVEPYLTYMVADPQGNVIHSTQIPVAASTMIHSFAITEQDVIFWEGPVLFDLVAAAQGADNPFAWQPEYGSRIGVMPLGGDGSQIRWVEIENCYVYHEVNAYRDGDEIVLDVCHHQYMFSGERFGSDPLDLHRWHIGTAGEQLTFRDEVVSTSELELPTHDRRFSGRPHRYGWFVDSEDHPLTLNFTGTTVVDYRTGDVRTWKPGPTKHPAEAFFVAGGPGEGEGWLFTFVYDHATDQTDLAILDALDVEKGPVAEIRMPQRVPYGFHAVWVPA